MRVTGHAVVGNAHIPERYAAVAHLLLCKLRYIRMTMLLVFTGSINKI